jgi:hypothetical protein
MNVFEEKKGTENLRRPEIIGSFLLGTILISFIISKWGVISGLLIMLSPILIFFISMIFLKPRVGIITLFTLNFFVMGIYRYLGMIPWGLTIDGILILIYLSLFLQSFHRKIPWENAGNDLTLLALVWFGYSLFQLVNPEAVSRVAWFYGMRSISLYMILVIPLIFIIFNRPKDIRFFFLLWGIYSILGTMKGIQQKFWGPDHFEQLWLDSGGASTHILFGVLRVFSFYSDAGQFGAAQGHAGVVFALLAFGEEKRKLMIFYALVSVLGLYGMMISGTRGAIGVPFGGFALAIILRKNLRAMSAGVIFLMLIFIFFKFTTIGQGNDSIRRMRTAFDPNDPSLQLRLQNQLKLKAYLASRPIGGGLGSSGSFGQQYSRGSFLSQVASDSWYVKIWMEMGVVGLVLHLGILFYILGKSSFLLLFKVRDDWLKTQGIALASGLAGMMVAAYGNAVLGQFPSSILIYTGMAFLFMLPKLDMELSSNHTIPVSENNIAKK